MIVFAYSALGAKRNVMPTTVGLEGTGGVSIENGIYDQLYADGALDHDTTSASLPTMSDWTYSTLFNALFQETLKAGNCLFLANELQCVRVKRVEEGSYDWLTITEIPIETEGDLSFTRIDFLARGNQTYRYALVPVRSDGTEGAYNINTVFSSFNGLWVCEKDIGYNALLDLNMNSTLNQVTANVVTLGRRYPYVNKYGKANYYTGSFTTTFIQMSTTDCSLDLDNAVKYREQVETFLTDGLPKIIKHMDGRIWLAMITDEISKDDGDAFWLPEQTVNFTEIGKYNSSTELYNAGLIDVNIESEVNADEFLS